jgi:hypothetical protein
MRGKRVGTAIVAIACVALAGACGSSAGSKSATDDPTTTTAKPNPAADQARAESLVLTAADLPTGWVAKPHVKDPSDKAENQKLAQCVGALNPNAQTADVDGDDFDMGSNEISSEVTVADTRAHFLSDSNALKSAKLISCTQTIFSEDLPKTLAKSDPGVTIHDLKLSRLSSPTYGEITVGLRASLTLTGPTGTSVQLVIDEFEFGAGRDEVTVTFDGQGAAVDPSLERSIVQKAAAKLGKTSA